MHLLCGAATLTLVARRAPRSGSRETVAVIPRIDVGALLEPVGDTNAATDLGCRIDAACREVGFFSVVGHGVDPSLTRRVEAAARAFFALPDREKSEIAMSRGGSAWRGWFPVGGELTSGVPDRKEGIYFGREIPTTDPRAARALHGPNLFPTQPADLRDAVLTYVEVMEQLAQQVLAGIALGLGLARDHFVTELTNDPTTLFRIFRYPAEPLEPDGSAWGVAEHTDYGLLTVLAQDATGGLEVRAPSGWVEVEPDPNAFVVNIGDMLDRITGGRYRSTAHRVRNRSSRGRLSMPFFLDPAWDATLQPLPLDDAPPADDRATRWDNASVHDFDGTYGEYLVAKVAKVFPLLRESVL